MKEELGDWLVVYFGTYGNIEYQYSILNKTQEEATTHAMDNMPENVVDCEVIKLEANGV